MAAGVLLGQPAIWTVPIAFGVMIVVSLLSGHAVPGNVDQIMRRMHLPEVLAERTYRPPVDRLAVPERAEEWRE